MCCGSSAIHASGTARQSPSLSAWIGRPCHRRSQCRRCPWNRQRAGSRMHQAPPAARAFLTDERVAPAIGANDRHWSSRARTLASQGQPRPRSSPDQALASDPLAAARPHLSALWRPPDRGHASASAPRPVPFAATLRRSRCWSTRARVRVSSAPGSDGKQTKDQGKAAGGRAKPRYGFGRESKIESYAPWQGAPATTGPTVPLGQQISQEPVPDADCGRSARPAAGIADSATRG